MAQDFAKSRSSGGKAGKKKPARAATRTPAEDRNHWSWFFSGLFSGVLLCVIGYFSLNQLDNSASLRAELAGGLAGGEEGNDTDLQFYEYLPQAEVEVNVVPVDVAAPGETESNPVTYLLQAGSFPDPNDAEAMRARLILMNLEARIQPTNLSGRTWYRVQAGPFVGRNSVQAAEQILRENNIDPMRLRPSAN